MESWTNGCANENETKFAGRRRDLQRASVLIAHGGAVVARIGRAETFV
jgi:hypothetical protein